MKTLYIVRHAQAEDHYRYQQDFDRELTQQGVMKAVRVGKQLAAEGLLPQLIITSPAARTLRTAELLAENMGLPQSVIVQESELYNASPRILLQVIGRISDSYDKAMLVGHNPGVSYLAEWLTGSREIDGMATCSMAHIELHLTQWAAADQHCGRLVSYRDFD